MVNGKVWPNMNVDMGQYRFRILNGSNSRFYNINFSNGMSFIQIGSDGGYLQAPITLTSLLLAPAERADIIVDFSNLSPGTNSNSSKQRFNIKHRRGNTNSGSNNAIHRHQPNRNHTFQSCSGPNPFNPTLAAASFPTLPTATKQRILTLFEVMNQNSIMDEALLDGQIWSAPISETPEVGATEEWIIVNPTMDPHPIHLHLIQFQLVQREAFDPDSIHGRLDALNGEPPLNHPTVNVPDLNHYLSNLVSPSTVRARLERHDH